MEKRFSGNKNGAREDTQEATAAVQEGANKCLKQGMALKVK